MSRFSLVYLWTVLPFITSGCCGDSLERVSLGIRRNYGVVGDTVSARAAAVTTGGSFQPCTLYDSQNRPEAFTWTTSDASVATVSEAGLITMRGVGEALIGVSTSGMSAPGRLTIIVSAATSSNGAAAKGLVRRDAFTVSLWRPMSLCRVASHAA